MKSIKVLVFFILILFSSINNSLPKEPSQLINEIVNKASAILSSSDPVEAKIIKLNDLAELSVDIDGIAIYALGKHRKTISAESKIKYLPSKYKVNAKIPTLNLSENIKKNIYFMIERSLKILKKKKI